MTVFDPKSGIDITSIKSQLQQLKVLHESGALNEAVHMQAKEALERKLLDLVLTAAPADSPEAAAAVPVALSTAAPVPRQTGSVVADVQPQEKPSKVRLPVVVGIVVLAVLAGGGYYWLGRSDVTPVNHLPVSSLSTPLMPKLPGEKPANDKEPQSTQAGDIGTLSDKLAARLAKQPNDPQGWVMLGRSYSVLGRPAEAVKAFEKAMTMLPDDKALLADYAAAVAALTAVGSGGNGEPMAQVAAPSQGQERVLAQASKLTVSGTVTLAAALLKKVQPTDTVFVVARPPTGSRMPLAALRVQVKDLPLHFTLDDSMGMSPAVKLSTAGKVIVSARVSKSGNAIPEKGDLSGETSPVMVGAKGLAIEINTAVN
jgi:cytochrome c-type biogenesis protein CcmH